MPYSCTSVLRDCPIYINVSVISVLFPDAMSRTLGSEGERTPHAPVHLSGTTHSLVLRYSYYLHGPLHRTLGSDPGYIQHGN